MEGKSYRLTAYGEHALHFRFHGGRGMIEIHEAGVCDLDNKKYNEHYCMSKPTILAKNIIFGGMYIDTQGEAEAINMTTGERVVINHYSKTKKNNTYIHGKAYDSEGVLKYEIIGSYLDEMKLKNVVTGEVEWEWKEPPMIPHANL